MAHELSTVNERAGLMYVGEVPWHDLGSRLDAPATAAEAIDAAGLDFEFGLSPLATAEGAPVPRKKAVVRRDNGEVIGVVGNGYVPVTCPRILVQWL